MWRIFLPVILLIGLAAGFSKKKEDKPRVLVFSKTAAFHHVSISAGIQAIQLLGAENGFDVDITDNASFFNEDSLKKYSAVIFLNTTGDVLDYRQQADFERYIQAGGGYVGVHAAADCEYHWPWYGKLVGAYFNGHPRQQKATLLVKDRSFLATKHLPEKWERFDEWYNFRNISSDINILIFIDEKSYEGGKNGESHPMVWYHQYDGGRSFYMGLGHTDESYSEPDFLKLLLGGIQYAMGDNKTLNYNKVVTMRVPDEDRFSKEILVGGLDEPTEIAVLPNLSVLIAERKGALQFYNSVTKNTTKVGQFKVYYYYNNDTIRKVSSEEGLLGLAADPDYSINHWIYLYYSLYDKAANRLSRFRFQNNKLDRSSEKIIIEIPVERGFCCHTGGSIAFDAEKNLYLSVGNNTSNKRDGFASLDDRPGYEFQDDARGSGNTNDLRGKILRIKVLEDGSYTIPKGNLFSEGTPNTKPEIYVMGNRNPYRISVDKHTGFLYWGDVGPDARKDMKSRGPRGYDEVNQARKAGNFGWPFFVGNNYPYHEYNYATGESGPSFNHEKPQNNSRNNTGLHELPPAQPAFIWYPYDSSKQFPILGAGGRTAMAGPVYYAMDYPIESRYPDYYNGKLFIYDWIRDWIRVVTMDQKGDLQTIEPFMSHVKFNKIIDMETGRDGKLYIVEYGSGWFEKNPEAALSYINYNGGNRKPVAVITANKEAGVLPLKVQFSAKGSYDPDGDDVTYIWNFGRGVKKRTTNGQQVEHIFTLAGTYTVFVTVSDSKGNETNSKTIRVIVNDKAAAPQKPFETDSATKGMVLMKSLDCQSCHKVNGKSIGPSFTQVAAKYKNNLKVQNYLAAKIMEGGSGVWGDVMMPPHPGVSKEDSRRIVEWILSLHATKIRK